MDALCYYVCTGLSSSSLLGLEKLRFLSSNSCFVTNPIPRLISGTSVYQSPAIRCSNNGGRKRSEVSVVGNGDGTKSSNGKSKKRSKPQKTQLITPPESKKWNPNKGLGQNGDPLGRRDLGKVVVKWLRQGMRAMATEVAAAEVRGDFDEFEQRMGPGVTFLIEAQPYLTTVPMPLGLEAVCLKACAHYPTLFDHFQRELREVLNGLKSEAVFEDWRETQSWKLLKQLASSAQHKAIARKASQPKRARGALGIDIDKVRKMQTNIDQFTNHMANLLRVERDAELEFTQEELNAVPIPDENSDSSKPIEFLVTHGQSQQELCDTLCNLSAVSTSTGLGGMHLVVFKVEGNHQLPPTTLSPGDMVCVRTCDSRGAGATSCMQGFVDNFGEDGCSISVALESRHGDATFSKLFGKLVRIDRIHGLADTRTYEVFAKDELVYSSR